jgi:hypothetical protein
MLQKLPPQLGPMAFASVYSENIGVASNHAPELGWNSSLWVFIERDVDGELTSSYDAFIQPVFEASIQTFKLWSATFSI